jgi:hypothetical protein
MSGIVGDHLAVAVRAVDGVAVVAVGDVMPAAEVEVEVAGDAIAIVITIRSGSQTRDGLESRPDMVSEEMARIQAGDSESQCSAQC